MEKENNIDPIDIINQNDTYVGMLSTNKSLDVTNYKCSSTEIKTQDKRMPYHHPNHKSHCIAQGIDQQQNQYEYEQHSS
jgi:hypothetical protein